MGREAKILLGFLGLLAGVFVGVLSMKLLVPRPPAGAGPDIRAEVAAVGGSLDVVEPPVLSSAPSGFTEAPPLFPDPVPSLPASESHAFVTMPGGDRYADRASRFGDPSAAASAPLPAGATTVPHDAPPDRLPTRDPFVATAGFNQPAEAPPDPAGPESFTDASPTDREPAVSPSVAGDPASPPRPAAAAISPPDAPPAPVQPPRPAGYVVQPGDSWWTLAERAYGDGRFYRLLFVWNRTIDPRVSLVPGTTLQIPPLDVLAARWPGLVPR